MATLAAHATPFPRRIAPIRHTALLVLVFLALAVGGAVLQHRVSPSARALPRPPRVVPIYLSLLAMEWGMVLYVWRGGLRRSGISPRELIGGRGRPRDLMIDVAIGLGAWAVWGLLSRALELGLGPDRAASVGTLLPRHPIEIVLWVALSLSAGFCEELVFRGYFQSQFLALTHRAWLALALQAVLFGVSHGYQGVHACLKITFYGLLLGTIALGRKSLRPGMLAHAWTDIAAGLFRL